MTDLRDAAMNAKAWPFEEARKLVKRYAKAPPEKGYVLFRDRLWPVGPAAYRHVRRGARTTMVRRAFERCRDIPPS